MVCKFIVTSVASTKVSSFPESSRKVRKSSDVLFRCRITGVSDPKQINPREYDAKSVMKKARKQMKVAEKNFHKGNFHGCIEIYNEWINKLEKLSVSCDEDDEKRTQYLIKLYQNISLSHNKVNKPKKALLKIRQLERLTDISSNPVMLFAKGKAKMMVGEFDSARKYFRMTSAISPDDSLYEACNELNRLEETMLLNDAEMKKNHQLLFGKDHEGSQRAVGSFESSHQY